MRSTAEGGDAEGGDAEGVVLDGAEHRDDRKSERAFPRTEERRRRRSVAYKITNPRLAACTTASVRLVTPSFVRIAFTWNFTV